MAELGIDISGQWSKTIEDLGDQQFDYVVTVCDNAREVCPLFPDGGKHIHQGFVDPSATIGSQQQIDAAFSDCRNQIQAWLLEQFEQ
jgi:arsenate reductase